jgi:hypothetical protein
MNFSSLWPVLILLLTPLDTVVAVVIPEKSDGAGTAQNNHFLPAQVSHARILQRQAVPLPLRHPAQVSISVPELRSCHLGAGTEPWMPSGPELRYVLSSLLW